MNLVGVKVFTDSTGVLGLAIDASTTVYSKPFKVADCDNWAVHLEWTGAAVDGTVTIFASCKPNPDPTDEDDWVQCLDSDGNVIELVGPSGTGAGKSLEEFGNSGALWYMLKYDPDAGTGTLSAWVNGKAG